MNASWKVYIGIVKKDKVKVYKRLCVSSIHSKIYNYMFRLVLKVLMFKNGWKLIGFS